MNLNRRKFFRVTAIGALAATLPKCLQAEKIAGKELILPSDNLEYATPKISNSWGNPAATGLWNIKEGRDIVKQYEIREPVQPRVCAITCYTPDEVKIGDMAFINECGEIVGGKYSHKKLPLGYFTSTPDKNGQVNLYTQNFNIGDLY